MEWIRALSSVGSERRPYKAEVIGSNPIAPTFPSNYRFAGGHGSEYQIKKSWHSVKGFFHISRNPSVTGGSALRECVSRVKWWSVIEPFLASYKFAIIIPTSRDFIITLLPSYNWEITISHTNILKVPHITIRIPREENSDIRMERWQRRSESKKA